MNNQNNLHTAKVINRKNFFSKVSKSFMGVLLVSSFPFNLFGRSSSSQKTEIKINPLAVKREKDVRKNG
jgi:hypothetical protein